MPFPNPFDYGYGRLPTVNEQLPQLSPEEERSYMGQVLDTGLSGLGWLGGVLSKPRRALWGVIGGLTGHDTWREALNILPFSDAMGITDQSQEITGKKILGGTDDTPFLSGQGMGGLALDILGDPLTYLTLGAGASTKLGQAAGKLGVLPKTGALRSAGFAAASPEAGQLAQATGKSIADIAGQSLGGHIGFGLPFMGNAVTADLSGLGSAISAIPGAAKAGNFIAETTAPMRRAFGGMFNPEMMGQYSEKGQEIAPQIFKARQAAKVQAAEDILPVARAFGTDALKDEQSLRYMLENTNVPGASQGAWNALPKAQAVNQDLLAAEQAAGIPTKQLDDYFRRSVNKPELDVGRNASSGAGPMSPGHSSLVGRAEILKNIPGETQTIERMVRDPMIGTKARAAADNTQAAAHIMQNYGITDPAQAHDLADFLWTLNPERQKIGFFSKHSLSDLEARAIAGRQAVATAQKVTEILGTEATTALSPGAKSLAHVLESVGLEGAAYDNLYSALVQAGKVQPGGNVAATLGSHFVTQEVADALSHATKAFTTPEILGPVMKFVDNFTNLLKTGLTSAFPSFHARNFVSGTWQNYVMMGAQNLPESYGAAVKAIRGEVVPGISSMPFFKGMGINDAQATEMFADLVFKHGVTGMAGKELVGAPAAQDLLMRIPGAMPGRETGLDALKAFGRDFAYNKDLGVGQAVNPLNVRGVGDRSVSGFAPVKAGQTLGNEIEDMGRVAGMYGMMKQGYSPEIAAAMTKTAHVDYEALTSVERQVMRRLIPFYSFMKGNVPYQLRQIAENPGGVVATSVKAASEARDQGGFTPAYLGSGVALPLGQEENGRQRYLSQLGLPFEQLGEMSMRGLAGGLNPLIKYPLEQMAGQQFFSGRDLRDLQSRTGRLVGSEPPQAFDNLLMNSPISRLISTLGTMDDDRKSWGDAALNLGTGMRLTDVNQAGARPAAIRNAVEDQLRGQPGVGRFERLYVSPQNLPQLSPKEQALYRLYRNEEERRRRQQRQQQGLAV